MRGNPIVVFIFVSLLISGVEHYFFCLLLTGHWNFIVFGVVGVGVEVNTNFAYSNFVCSLG